MPVYARVDPHQRRFLIAAFPDGALGATTLEEFVVEDWPAFPHSVRHARDVLASHGWPTRPGVFVEHDGQLLFDVNPPLEQPGTHPIPAQH